MHDHDPASTLPGKRRLWDGLGILVSSVCLVHCLAPAVLAGAAVFLGGDAHETGATHRWFFAVAAAAGLLAFLPGFRHHRSWTAPVLAACGFLALGTGSFAGHDLVGHDAEILFTVTGGLLLLAAHAVNLAHCRRSEPCPAR